MMIHDPTEYPGDVRFVPMSSEVAVVLEPIYYTASEDLHTIDLQTRMCLFQHEVNQRNLLENLQYSAHNCR